MKKIITIIIFYIISLNLNAQIVSIPDTNFKNILLNFALVNTNGDREIQVSEASSYNGVLYVSYAGITDLTGIEAFTSITRLYCNNNNLVTLDISQNSSLTQLYCYNNQFESLFLSSNSLSELDCESNNLTTINLSMLPALTMLVCGYNNLTSLDVSNNILLDFLSCRNNNLTSLNLSSNPNLKILNCSFNNISSLDFSLNYKLRALNCFNCNLTSIDVSSNPDIMNFQCANNNLNHINLNNENNTKLRGFNFNTLNNPGLLCIDVDSLEYSNANWTNIDPWTNFSENCETMSIDEIKNKHNINIYPNPVGSYLTIETEDVELANIFIYNVIGELVYNQSINNDRFIINMNDKPSGVYYIRITDVSKNIFNKIIIKQ